MGLRVTETDDDTPRLPLTGRDRELAALCARLGDGEVTLFIRVLMPDELAAWRDRVERAGPREPQRSGLTPRELQVLGLITAGLTNKEIAARLEVTPKTVMHFAGAVYRKLGVRGRAEAAVAALRRGLVSAG